MEFLKEFFKKVELGKIQQMTKKHEKLPHSQHCGHTTTAICVSYLILMLRLLSHHVQFLHLITDKRHKMLGFRLIYVHQIHIVSFSFKII